MWSNFTKIEKIASITLGLLALIGLTAYVSGGSNGQKIFSTAITLIFIIIGGSFIILKIKQERQYKKHNTSHYYEQYKNKNNKQRNESNQRQREEEQWNRQKREEERGQRENEEQERQREEAYEQQENYSEQKNLNPEILEYYHILNLKPGSSKQQIKEAYRELSKMVHPDKNKGSTFSTEFQKKINDAYNVLMDQN